MNLLLKIALLTCLSAQSMGQSSIPDAYFQIRVVDEATGRGIPMVELTSMNFVSYFTDSQGYIAFREEGLMDRDIYFKVKSAGYYYPPDTLGHRGVIVHAAAGDSAVIKMQRLNVAERLYRVTGSGIYRDSWRLGIPVPLKKPLLNAGVLGQDSNLSTLYRGKIFWIWGDSFLPGQYIGNFSVSGATSELPDNGGLPPSTGVDLSYFTDEQGYSKKMIDPKGPGYVWFDWLMNIPGENGAEKLVAKYARVNAYFGNYERGIAIFNDEKEIFERYRRVDDWLDEGHNCHHPFSGFSGGQRHFYLTSEFSFCRVAPGLESLADPGTYECYSCLEAGANFDQKAPALDRNADGSLNYTWKKATDAIDYKRQQLLLDSGFIEPGDKWVQLLDFETGEPVQLTRGSFHWNEFRQRWILIMGVKDMYFAEADTPVGPWLYARKVAAHNQFLYNPVHHPFFDEDGGRQIYFEGTFTKFFSVEPEIPWYNYNQLMYSLDLDDDRTSLPVPVYRMEDGNLITGPEIRQGKISGEIADVPFLALPEKVNAATLVPLYRTQENGVLRLQTRGGEGEPFCYALPVEYAPEKPFLGNWEATINFASFNNFFVFEVGKKGRQIDVDTGRKTFRVSNPAIDGEILRMTLEQEGNTYLLEGKIVNGEIKGSFENTASGSKGTWAATKQGCTWWPAYSGEAVPLYEYRNNISGIYRYSTNPSLPGKELVRMEKPVCKVWQYPYNSVIADFSILPAD